MSAALCKCEAVPTNDTLETPIVPKLTPLNVRGYLRPWKVKMPLPPPAPTMNPALNSLAWTLPVAACDCEGAANSIKVTAAATTPNFTARTKSNIVHSCSQVTQINAHRLIENQSDGPVWETESIFPTCPS